MSVRITQSMQMARTLRDQQLNLARMDEYSRNMSDGTILHRPSDDPIRVARALRLKTELRVNETYKADLEAASSWTSKTDESLRTLSDIISRVRELTNQAANGTLKDEDKQKAASELKELKAASINVANDDYMGRYQFSGYKTDKKFIKADGYRQADGTYTYYNKDDLDLAGLNYEKINYNIGVGQKTDINITGIQVFGNEYFTTRTRATDSLPFSDEPTSVMGANMTVRLQKYEDPKRFYEKDDKYTQEDAAAEDLENDTLESKYERTRKLETTEGSEIVLEDINFYGTYKKDDVNQVVEDLNTSLRKKIDEQFGANSDKAKELKQSVQFVNDGGKISLVTDHNYAGKIAPEKLNLSEVKLDSPAKSTSTPNKNGEINIQNQVDYSTQPVKAYFNFDLELTPYKKDENGDIDTTQPETAIKIDNIILANSYSDEYSKDQVKEVLRSELQTKINAELMKKGLSADLVKVVMDGEQPKLVVDREYGAKVTNTPTGVAKLTPTLADQSYTPADENPKNNKSQVIDTGIVLPTNGDDALISLSFDMSIQKPKTYGDAYGDIMKSNPGVDPVTGVVPDGKAGFIVQPFTASSTNEISGIGLTKIYSTKNGDGSLKNKDALLKEIAADLQQKINVEVVASKPVMQENPVKVEVKDGKINLVIDGNVKYDIKNVKKDMPDNTFSENPITPTKDTKSPINLPMPTVTAGKDTHVYMDLNMDMVKYPKDINGNPITTRPDGSPYTEEDKQKMDKINIDEITLNKTYPAKKPDGSNYTADEIKEQIFNDVKAKIEEKLGQLNPPLDKKAINIKKVGDNIEVSVYPDMEVTMSSDIEKPASITSETSFVPKQEGDLKPEREMMPYFEMLDRIMKFMDEGNSKGLSRMLDVVDYHAKNNQKNQGIGGGKTKMYDIMIERTQDVKLNYTELLSNTQDTDYSEMVMRMSLAQNIYRASLSVTAKLMQPSLVDFLR